jgi:hypothetical protein
MMAMRWLILGTGACVVATLSLLSGCVVKTNQEWIRDAAARDLRCPGGQVVVHHYTKTPDRKGATGCGKTARWNRVCGKDGWCRWKLEGPPAPAPPKR